MTEGEYRVGIDFNPSDMDEVSEIKRAAADLIDLIDRIPDAHSGLADAEVLRTGQIRRLKALAMSEIENGAMWAVKAATKGPPK